jgi:hypothetical protein
MICWNNRERIMAKADINTKATSADVDGFVAAAEPKRRQDEAW